MTKPTLSAEVLATTLKQCQMTTACDSSYRAQKRRPNPPKPTAPQLLVNPGCKNALPPPCQDLPTYQDPGLELPSVLWMRLSCITKRQRTAKSHPNDACRERPSQGELRIHLSCTLSSSRAYPARSEQQRGTFHSVGCANLGGFTQASNFVGSPRAGFWSSLLVTCDRVGPKSVKVIVI